MGTELWFFYDIALLFILITSVLTGYRRGFLKMLVSTVCYIIVFAVVWAISLPVGNAVYNSYFKDKNAKIISEMTSSQGVSSAVSDVLQSNGVNLTADQVQQAIQSTGGDTDKLYEYMIQQGIDVGTQEEFDKLMAEGTSDAMQQILDNSKIPYSNSASDKVLQSKDSLGNVLTKLAGGSGTELGSAISNGYLKKLEIYMVRLIFSVIFASLLMIIVRIFTNKIKIPERMIKARAANSFLGGVVGIIDSLFYVFIFVAIVNVLVMYGQEQMTFFNTEVINHTKFFQHFYRVFLKI